MARRTSVVLLGGLVVLVLLLGTGYVLAQASQSDAPLAPSVLADASTPADTSTLAETASVEAASAPRPTGGFTDGGDFLISTQGRDQGGASIAWNEDNDEYLVVWYEVLAKDIWGSPTQMSIQGRIYSVEGVPIGEAFDISVGDGRRYPPSAAYNSTAGEYLVVWVDQRFGTSDGTVYGQRVDASGVLLDNATTPEDETDPSVNFGISSNEAALQARVAYNPVTDEYMVVWDMVDDGTGDQEINGQCVDADGVLLGDAIEISKNSTGSRTTPEIAYNSLRDEYLVVWLDGRASGIDVYGQRVDADGSLLDNPNTVADETSPVVNFPICTSTALNNHAGVAYHARADEYLVVWTQSYDIFGRVVDGNGDLLDVADTPEDESDPTVEFIIADPNAQVGAPDVTYNANFRQYLVVWADARHQVGYEIVYDIYGLRMGPGGVKAPQGEFAISRAVADQAGPAVAYSTNSKQYLVVWTDERNGEDADIYGQRVWWPGLLLGHNFGISSASLSQSYPAVAYNHRTHEYLAVWADERNGNADIYGQRYDRDGIPLGSNFAIWEGSGDQINPDVAYNSIENEYLVVWYDKADGDVKWRVISALGTPTSSPVGTRSLKECHPSVAYNSNPAHNDYVVVYAMKSLTGYDEYMGAILVYANGSHGAARTMSYSPGSRPDIVYNDTTNEYLAVWSNTQDDAGDIYGRQLDADGGFGAAEFVIAQDTDAQAFPAVAWNDSDNEYLVAWQDYRTSGTTGADIYGRRVGASSNVLGSDFIISSAAGVTHQLHPAVVYVQSADRYRVVWDDDRDSAPKGTGYDVRGRWVTSAGAVVGIFDDIVIRQMGWQQYPALVYSEGFDQALTVWHDGRSGVEYDVYGTFSALDTDPPTARFTVDDRWGEAGDDFVFNAWPSSDAAGGTPRGALAVRWDLNSDGTWETEFGFQKYFTKTVNLPGVYTVTLEVRDLAWYTDTISHRIVVTTSLVTAFRAQQAAASQPTATLTISPTYGVAGTSFSLDASGSTGSGSIVARWDWENDGEFDTSFGAALTETHVYTVAGDYTARVEIWDTSTRLSHAALDNITVLPGTPISLTVLPKPVDAVGGEQVDFYAAGWDVYDNKMLDPAVTWSVTDSTAGDIDSTGVFTAGMQAGTYTDVILAQSGVVSDTASVTVFWPRQVYLPLVVRNY